MFERNYYSNAVPKDVASSVSSVAEDILNKLPKKPQYASLFSKWRTAVGDDFASISAPYKIVTQNDQKILVLKSKKGRSIELQHCSQQILRKIHYFLGKDVFSFVKIIQLDSDDGFQT